ncbi:hypothetical protein [Fusibacter ferrireducens]|uniref:DUF2628 domain-containing protein n=1 Tax=Fusibacter ferrireducens TaxID=2785058 RepID=A0ABR9ZME3_9FIRM|nr:hypothetical protein [Fusibacter ferrireducens]MBF4691630.1 hypothetical protein [Fusibacter ferrireducens]
MNLSICETCGNPITNRSELTVSKEHFFSIPKAYHHECYIDQMEDIRSYYTQVEPINSVLYSLRIFMLTAVYFFLFSIRIRSVMYYLFLGISGSLLGIEWFSRIYSLVVYERQFLTKKHMRI